MSGPSGTFFSFGSEGQSGPHQGRDPCPCCSRKVWCVKYLVGTVLRLDRPLLPQLLSWSHLIWGFFIRTPIMVIYVPLKGLFRMILPRRGTSTEMYPNNGEELHDSEKNCNDRATKGYSSALLFAHRLDVFWLIWVPIAILVVSLPPTAIGPSGGPAIKLGGVYSTVVGNIRIGVPPVSGDISHASNPAMDDIIGVKGTDVSSQLSEGGIKGISGSNTNAYFHSSLLYYFRGIILYLFNIMMEFLVHYSLPFLAAITIIFPVSLWLLIDAIPLNPKAFLIEVSIWAFVIHSTFCTVLSPQVVSYSLSLSSRLFGWFIPSLIQSSLYTPIPSDGIVQSGCRCYSSDLDAVGGTVGGTTEMCHYVTSIASTGNTTYPIAPSYHISSSNLDLISYSTAFTTFSFHFFDLKKALIGGVLMGLWMGMVLRRAMVTSTIERLWDKEIENEDSKHIRSTSEMNTIASNENIDRTYINDARNIRSSEFSISNIQETKPILEFLSGKLEYMRSDRNSVLNHSNGGDPTQLAKEQYKVVCDSLSIPGPESLYNTVIELCNDEKKVNKYLPNVKSNITTASVNNDNKHSDNSAPASIVPDEEFLEKIVKGETMLSDMRASRIFLRLPIICYVTALLFIVFSIVMTALHNRPYTQLLASQKSKGLSIADFMVSHRSNTQDCSGDNECIFSSNITSGIMRGTFFTPMYVSSPYQNGPYYQWNQAWTLIESFFMAALFIALAEISASSWVYSTSCRLYFLSSILMKCLFLPSGLVFMIYDVEYQKRRLALVDALKEVGDKLKELKLNVTDSSTNKGNAVKKKRQGVQSGASASSETHNKDDEPSNMNSIEELTATKESLEKNHDDFCVMTSIPQIGGYAIAIILAFLSVKLWKVPVVVVVVIFWCNARVVWSLWPKYIAGRLFNDVKSPAADDEVGDSSPQKTVPLSMKGRKGTGSIHGESKGVKGVYQQNLSEKQQKKDENTNQRDIEDNMRIRRQLEDPYCWFVCRLAFDDTVPLRYLYQLLNTRVLPTFLRLESILTRTTQNDKVGDTGSTKAGKGRKGKTGDDISKDTSSPNAKGSHHSSISSILAGGCKYIGSMVLYRCRDPFSRWLIKLDRILVAASSYSSSKGDSSVDGFIFFPSHAHAKYISTAVLTVILFLLLEMLSFWFFCSYILRVTSLGAAASSLALLARLLLYYYIGVMFSNQKFSSGIILSLTVVVLLVDVSIGDIGAGGDDSSVDVLSGHTVTSFVSSPDKFKESFLSPVSSTTQGSDANGKYGAGTSSGNSGKGRKSKRNTILPGDNSDHLFSAAAVTAVQKRHAAIQREIDEKRNYEEREKQLGFFFSRIWITLQSLENISIWGFLTKPFYFLKAQVFALLFSDKRPLLEATIHFHCLISLLYDLIVVYLANGGNAGIFSSATVTSKSPSGGNETGEIHKSLHGRRTPTSALPMGVGPRKRRHI